MKVVIIGTGYVGLVSGVCFAEIGHEVVCVDVDPKIINSINNCKPHIYEDGLDDLLKRNIKKGNLSATINLKKAISSADVTMIAVGTPFDGNFIDLKYIKTAISNVAQVLKFAADYHVVCIKSTVIPGTTENIVADIIENESNRKIGKDVGLCMNPEFLREGTAISDFMNPDRIIIGANDNKAAEYVKNIYSKFKNVEKIITTPSTAEMIKYASNAFLATVISYSNEIANICTSIDGVDAIDVMNGIHLDRRLSPLLPTGRVVPGLMSFLFPGTGFGGSCFPKDLKALYAFAKSNNKSAELLQSVINVNLNQPKETIQLLKQKVGNIKGKRITVLGLAFKPGTDDIRESPSIRIIEELISLEANVMCHDPIAIENMKLIFSDNIVSYFYDLKDALQKTEAVILVTSWPEYNQLKDLINRSIPVIDGRRFLNKNDFKNYVGIGLNNKINS